MDRSRTIQLALPDALRKDVDSTLKEWDAAGKMHRLWNADASLWTDTGESKWLGWLHVAEDIRADLVDLKAFVQGVCAGGFADAVVLGMGGSSVCCEVLSRAFGPQKGFPRLLVLDSTDPGQIATLERRIDIGKTLFFVSSKSGTTLEPNILKAYFFSRVVERVGSDRAGEHFVAITDPGSNLEKCARADGFRRIFHGVPSIGGRYSALSNFGMVPAAVMGLNVDRLLASANGMAGACASQVALHDNPGAVLGIALGVAARTGRDKVTLIVSPRIRHVGAWLEQLLAESTGKMGKGLIPIDREGIGSPDCYGDDRIFVYIRLDAEPDPKQDDAVSALQRTGRPVVRIDLSEVYDLGGEFFRWELATAVAGAVMGLNPFDQPDVEASKVLTRELTAAYEKDGCLPPELPFYETDAVRLFTGEHNANRLRAGLRDGPSLSGYLRSHLSRLSPGDYAALLAYVEMSAENEERLQAIRYCIRDRYKVATCLGFGPRYLHSTGQLYKGGPDTGVFLQITCDDENDLQIPGKSYTFGIVKDAQARADLHVLNERRRRALRVHLPCPVSEGLSHLQEAVQTAIST